LAKLVVVDDVVVVVSGHAPLCTGNFSVRSVKVYTTIAQQHSQETLCTNYVCPFPSKDAKDIDNDHL
jgi:hypothetical protein